MRINIKNKVIATIIIVIALGFLFYWYEFRPYQVKRDCMKEATRESWTWTSVDFDYKNCLRGKGI